MYNAEGRLTITLPTPKENMMQTLLHYSDHGYERRYVVERAEIQLNHNPSAAVVQSFVPPNQPKPVLFEGEILRYQVLADNGEWQTTEEWYILPSIETGKIYNEYGGYVGVNISNPRKVVDRVVAGWDKRDGGWFKGEPTTFRPDKVFVQP